MITRLLLVFGAIGCSMAFACGGGDNDDNQTSTASSEATEELTSSPSNTPKPVSPTQAPDELTPSPNPPNEEPTITEPPPPPDTTGPTISLVVSPAIIHAHHPSFGAFCVNEAQGPDRATLEAIVTDASGVASVQAVYFMQTGPNSSGQQVQPMTQVGDHYTLSVGPLTLWDSIQPYVIITVRALDTAGNEHSNQIQLNLIPCEA